MTDAERRTLTRLLEQHESGTRIRRLAEILLIGAVIEGLNPTPAAHPETVEPGRQYPPTPKAPK